MTREKDKALPDDAPSSEARTRQAKGSVQEAIGKIIGNAGIEQRGRSESKAGARQAEAEHPVDTPPATTSPVKTSPVTTSPVTTSPVTTSPLTTSPVDRDGND